jgi:putative flippase GtrA
MNISRSGDREKVRFIKFLIVGTIGAVVDFGVMNALSHFFHLSLTLSGTISFICALISNFLWNRYWTYPDSRSRSIPKQLSMFFVVNIIGILIRIPILRYLEPFFLSYLKNYSGIFSPLAVKNITLAIAVLIVLFWNFFINRYWTYNDID